MVEFYGPETAERSLTTGGDGSLPERLWHEFDVSPEDLIVEKTAASAFFPGRCELPSMLKERSVDTVLIAGTVAEDQRASRGNGSPAHQSGRPADLASWIVSASYLRY